MGNSDNFVLSQLLIQLLLNAISKHVKLLVNMSEIAKLVIVSDNYYNIEQPLLLSYPLQ